MDYLFYGNVTISKKTDTTTILLNIHCDSGESFNVYKLSSDDEKHLIYKEVSVERDADGIAAIFDIQDNQLSLFIISGQSNEIDIPFEVTYAVYNGEVISLPENNIVRLEGSTYISPDGTRKIVR